MALTKANGSYKIAPRSHSPWEDELPKTCIILCSFSLREGDDKLLPSTRKHLKQDYDRLKEGSNNKFDKRN